MFRNVKWIVLFVLVISCNVAGVYALESDDLVVTPKYDYVNSVSASIAIDSGNAIVKAVLDGKAGVTTIKCTMTLQKKSSGTWTYIHSWSKEVNARKITFKKTQSVNHGTYRTKAYFKVYKGASYEAITKYSSQITY